MTSDANSDACTDTVFKIAVSAEWLEAIYCGMYIGSQDDVRDGYIHLSTADQVAGTLARHFKAQTDLLLIAFAANDIQDGLRWERSPNGGLFPHYYGALRTDLAKWSKPVPIGPDGEPAADRELLAC